MQVTIHTVTINALSQVLSSSDAAPADEPPTALIFGTVSAPSIIASYCDTIASFKCYGPYGFHLSCAVFFAAQWCCRQAPSTWRYRVATAQTGQGIADDEDLAIKLFLEEDFSSMVDTDWEV